MNASINKLKASYEAEMELNKEQEKKTLRGCCLMQMRKKQQICIFYSNA